MDRHISHVPPDIELAGSRNDTQELPASDWAVDAVHARENGEPFTLPLSHWQTPAAYDASLDESLQDPSLLWDAYVQSLEPGSSIGTMLPELQQRQPLRQQPSQQQQQGRQQQQQQQPPKQEQHQQLPSQPGLKAEASKRTKTNSEHQKAFLQRQQVLFPLACVSRAIH